MAEMIRENLVLSGVRVGDVVTQKRAGLNPAMEGTRAIYSPRHPQGNREADPGMLMGRMNSADHGVPRAGRPGCLAGAPNRRLAITARQAILSRWSRAAGFSCSGSRIHGPDMGMAGAIANGNYPACSQAYSHQPQGGQWPLTGLKREQAGPSFTSRLRDARGGDLGT